MPTAVLTLGLAPWAIGLMVVGFFAVCLILILTILIQRPQGGGLAGAFGSGAGSGQTAFGAKTGDALTIATIGMFVIYIIAAIGLNFAIRPAVALPEVPAAQGTTPAGVPTPAGGAGAAPADQPPAVPAAVDAAAPATPAPENAPPPADAPAATEPAPATEAPATEPSPEAPAPATPEPAPAGGE